jgi:tryptophan-rich sensory protein
MSDRVHDAITGIASVLVCFLPGIFGGRSAPGEWYASLARPALTPPGWLFPVVWTMLYAMMAAALFLVMRRARGRQLWIAMAVFAVQLVLNALWTRHLPGCRRTRVRPAQGPS